MNVKKESAFMNISVLDLKKQYKKIKLEIDSAISEVLQDGNFILGRQVEELEKKIASISGTQFAIGVASGTDALLLALKGAGIGSGDEVITTPFTFFATAGAICNCGAKPVFVDIDPETYNLNPSLIEAKITKKTKAILPVHLFGHPADMDPIMNLSKSYNLYVIEDCAQAIGATYKNKTVGTIGDGGCFSFYPTKNLGCYGDGGMIVTNTERLLNAVKSLRAHGTDGRRYYHHQVGYNSRLDTMQAAILLVKLNYLDEWNMRRREIAELYNSHLKGLAVGLPVEKNYARHVYHQYTIRVKEREYLKDMLKAKDIGTMIYYPLSLHKQKAFEHYGYKIEEFPVCEEYERTVLSLPIYPELTNEEISEITSAIKECLLQMV